MNIAKLVVAFALTSFLALARAQTVEYIHTDALGSPVAVTNSSGAVIERTVYDPYGVVMNHPVVNGPGYTGHVMDAVTGLNYMQQRYYDPQLGRFLSVDPVTAYSAGYTAFNRYKYASNNPYRFTDPDGRADEPQKNHHPRTNPNSMQAHPALKSSVMLAFSNEGAASDESTVPSSTTESSEQSTDAKSEESTSEAKGETTETTNSSDTVKQDAAPAEDPPPRRDGQSDLTREIAGAVARGGYYVNWVWLNDKDKLGARYKEVVVSVGEDGNVYSVAYFDTTGKSIIGSSTAPISLGDWIAEHEHTFVQPR